MNAKLEILPVDHIELDLKNPRVAKWVEMYGNKISAEQMALALGAGGSQSEISGITFLHLKSLFEPMAELSIQ